MLMANYRLISGLSENHLLSLLAWGRIPPSDQVYLTNQNERVILAGTRFAFTIGDHTATVGSLAELSDKMLQGAKLHIVSVCYLPDADNASHPIHKSPIPIPLSSLRVLSDDEYKTSLIKL